MNMEPSKHDYPEPHPLEGLLDPVATAAFLGMNVATLADWRTKGTGPAYVKVGRYVRYQYSDLKAWLASRRKGA